MARFLLIHGSCHGAWCWRDLIPALEARGHGARAIDLPSHGADTAPPETVTLGGYAEAIAAALEPGDMLVGHSMAGFPISHAADLAPEGSIAKLIYLAAWLPEGGTSLAEQRAAAPRQPLADAMRPDASGRVLHFDLSKADDRFYHDCPAEAQAYARARLCPQPKAPQHTPLTLGPRFEAAERHYIACTEDRAVPPEAQAGMAARVPAARRRALNTGHSPFFAAPDKLAQILSDIAEAP